MVETPQPFHYDPDADPRGNDILKTLPEEQAKKITSDIETEVQQTGSIFLDEPTMPERMDFASEDNFNFALGQWREKMTVFIARLQYVKRKKAEQEPKPAYHKQLADIFQCFHGKEYPTYEDFLEETKESREAHALGYGGKRHFEFKIATVAEWINENEKFKTDINTGILYFNNGKTWIANAEPYLEYLVDKILGKEAKAAHYKNVEQSLKAKTYEKIVFSQKIACENGLLDLETLTFTEYGPDTQNEMPFFYISIKYDPTATCPHFQEFVNQVVYKDDIPLLQEWSGFCLFPDYRYHKIMWIIGSGRNGKSVWQRTVQAILGLENCSNVGLEEFDGTKQFSMSQLYGKLVNFCNEPRATNFKGESITLNTTLLKKATGQDVIDAEIKNKQKRLQFTNCAKITVLANRLPRINDQTTAFKERRLFLKFPFEFTGDKQIANVENKWLITNDEKSGILNWMIEGLQRLLKTGKFTSSKSQELVQLEFLRATDNIAAFVDETATYDRHFETLRSDALDAYHAYCDVYELDSENDKRFTAALKQTAHIKDGWVGKERGWIGVRFKKLETREDTDKPEVEQSDISNFTTDATATTRNLVPQNFEEGGQKIEKSEIRVAAVVSVVNRQCGYDCGNYGKVACPLFFNRIPKDNPLPLKCYSYTAPPPTEEGA